MRRWLRSTWKHYTVTSMWLYAKNNKGKDIQRPINLVSSLTTLSKSPTFTSPSVRHREVTQWVNEQRNETPSPVRTFTGWKKNKEKTEVFEDTVNTHNPDRIRLVGMVTPSLRHCWLDRKSDKSKRCRTRKPKVNDEREWVDCG